MLVAAACGTDAVGVAECRAVERARCAAAPPCGFTEIDECERYERDHCLHGVELEDISAGQVDACVADIQRAGRCAAGQGPNIPARLCSEPVSVNPPSTSCDIIRTPEVALSCAFLVAGSTPVPTPVPTPDAGP